MKKWIYIISLFFLFTTSCKHEPKIDDTQRRLINDVILPIFITDIHYKFNIQMVNQDKIIRITEYKVDHNDKKNCNSMYTFNKKGKVSEEYTINEKGDTTKITELTYDDNGRLLKVITEKQEEKIFNFTYDVNGLLESITDSLNNIIIKNFYTINKNGDVESITQQYPSYGKTSEYIFLFIDNIEKRYITNYYNDNELRYDSMPFSFNDNGTLYEVLGEKFDSTGIPNLSISADGINEIETKVDEYGNWTEQRIGNHHIVNDREVIYK